MDRFPAHANARDDYVVSGKFLWLLALPVLLRADGGKLILHGADAGETISVLADPFPLRAGQQTDFSVLVQKGEDPALDGAVHLQIGAADLNCTHARATDKVLFATGYRLPSEGRTDLTATHGAAHVRGTVNVLPALSPVVSYWPYFLICPVAVALFALNRRLRASARQRPRADTPSALC